MCQAARAQIAAPQQDLHLRGLGADDICVFIVVAVAYLLFHAGRSRELWARPGARLPRRETRYRSLARGPCISAGWPVGTALGTGCDQGSHPYGVVVPVVIKRANWAGREGSAVCARRAQSQFMMGWVSVREGSMMPTVHPDGMDMYYEVPGESEPLFSSRISRPARRAAHSRQRSTPGISAASPRTCAGLACPASRMAPPSPSCLPVMWPRSCRPPGVDRAHVAACLPRSDGYAAGSGLILRQVPADSRLL